jgi:tripeptide aminopeptidase
MVEQLFRDILETQSYSGSVESMTSLIVQYAHHFGADVYVVDGNVYVTKGTPTSAGYPCIVSHTDTVHQIIPNDYYSVGYDEKNGIIYAYDISKRNFTGIGGDDKVGIYIALAAVRDFPSIKACFFRDEEIGCVGSGLADLSFFDDCMYILQCDRKGNADFVTSISGTYISSKDFQDEVLELITAYGYKFHPGGITDVGKLTARQVGISCANMSCGYHNPHSTDEIIDVDDVNNTKDMVYGIIGTLNKKYPHKPEPTTYGTKNTYGKKSFGYYDTYDDWYGGYDYKPSAVKLDAVGSSPNEEYYLDWYGDMPTNEDLKEMLFEDIYYHSVLVKSGYKYCGNGVYSKTTGHITKYEEMGKIDVAYHEQYLSEDSLDECLEFADYCLEQKEAIFPDASKCCWSCGEYASDKDLDKNEGMCYMCFNKYNSPVL